MLHKIRVALTSINSLQKNNRNIKIIEPICIKRDMNTFNINHAGWEKLYEVRDEWRKRVTRHDFAVWRKNFKRTLQDNYAGRSGQNVALVCSHCSRQYRSYIGL